MNTAEPNKQAVEDGMRLLAELGLAKAAKTVLKRAEFDKTLSPQEKMAFIKRGGRVED